MEDFSGQVAIVTGGSRGIGFAIAMALAAAGAGVALVARSQSALDEAAAEITASGGRAIALMADVSDARAVESMVAETIRQLGPVDLLVNNAGAGRAIGPIWETDPDIWWDDVSINLKGTFLCARAVLPGMIARGSGRIVNVVSTLGMRLHPETDPNPYASAYTCGKAGAIVLTENLAAMARPHGVQVFALRPGFVLTQLVEKDVLSPAGRKWLPMVQTWLDQGGNVPPDHAAHWVQFLASGKVDNLSGRVFSISHDMEKLQAQSEEILREGRMTLRFVD